LNLAKVTIVKISVKVVTLARFQYELPDDGRRPKRVGVF